RHRDIYLALDVTQELHEGIGMVRLGSDDDDVGHGGNGVERIRWFDSQAARRLDDLRRFGDRAEFERHIAVGHHDVLKGLPRTGEIDDVRIIRDHEGYSDASIFG